MRFPSSARRTSRRASAISTASSAMAEALRNKPRLFVLLSAFTAVCAVTVGVLGWQLTLMGGRANVNSMIEEIEFLVSTQISTYVLEASTMLSTITDTQVKLFEVGELLVCGNKDAETNQVGTTIYTYACGPDGTILGNPIYTDSNPGKNTYAKPGNNFTLQNSVGGTSGANLNYTTSGQSGFSKLYLLNGLVIKTNYEFAINQVTGEHVVFANDWTIQFISDRINSILKITDFPIFAAVVRCSNGFIIGSSTKAATFAGTKMLPMNSINDPFLQDFSNFVNTTYVYGSINDMPNQLQNIAVYIDTYFPGSGNWFVDRKINNQNWKLALNHYSILGQDMLFLVYMNVDSVEEQLSTLSAKTGYTMIGIILAFGTVGVVYSTLISRQLHRVVCQLRLLKDFNFSEVMGNEADIKNHRSFIYEVAELEKCFHSMVVVFNDIARQGASSIQRPSVMGQPPAGARPGGPQMSYNPGGSYAAWKRPDSSVLPQRPAQQRLAPAIAEDPLLVSTPEVKETDKGAVDGVHDSQPKELSPATSGSPQNSTS
ncbi:hypothetical protein HDU79_007258 [Rhizoclosmatium sp. JEL0117]|nr:hypothetical protein HDU79_007258 [Rhizoclosmatium sp. JEL0117]